VHVDAGVVGELRVRHKDGPRFFRACWLRTADRADRVENSLILRAAYSWPCSVSRSATMISSATFRSLNGIFVPGITSSTIGLFSMIAMPVSTANFASNASESVIMLTTYADLSIALTT
jgi:hypothetical protein